jgi:hypothetical protein
MTQAAIFRQGDALRNRLRSTKARMQDLDLSTRIFWGHDGACPSTKLLSALHRSRGYDQFVTLQRRHFDVPPKVVGVGALARFPTKAFVKAAIE